MANTMQRTIELPTPSDNLDESLENLAVIATAYIAAYLDFVRGADDGSIYLWVGALAGESGKTHDFGRIPRG